MRSAFLAPNVRTFALLSVSQSFKIQMKSKIRNDILLAVFLLLLAFSIFIVFKLSAKEGGCVSVRVDGEIIASYPLDKDTEVSISAQDGGVNVLTIENGTAFVSYADCRDEICVKHRKIKYNGETIVCLPHKLVITVEGDVDTGSIDAVS